MDGAAFEVEMARLRSGLVHIAMRGPAAHRAEGHVGVELEAERIAPGEGLHRKVVALGEVHGYAISQRLQEMSRYVVQVPQGSLYPALYRLETRGWIAAEWGESENNRRAKYYKLTGQGRRQLQAETENWKRLSSGVAGVLDAQAEQL